MNQFKNILYSSENWNMVSKDGNKIAIVVIGYNRKNSIERLLGSIQKAEYNGENVPLVISLDASNNNDIKEYAKSFNWPFGEKYVRIYKEKMGLKNHIFACGDLTEIFRAVIILEDDLYVSTVFYDYILQALKVYENNFKVSGISLYMNETNDFIKLPYNYLKDGSDVVACQTVVSWGQCWSKQMWLGFRIWLSSKMNDEDCFQNLDMPDCIQTWGNAWSKYYFAYNVSTDKYYIVPTNSSLSTNFSEKGAHESATSSNLQVNLQFSKRNYIMPDYDCLIKYDIYGIYIGLYGILGFKTDELCIDLWGTNLNKKGKKYILSPLGYPYKIIKSYGLKLKPIEMNVINNISGQGLFLYDTTVVISKKEKGFSPEFINYIYPNISRKITLRYSMQLAYNYVINRLKTI
jgi:hypothetical protein